MADKQQLKTYRQKPVEVLAFRWGPKMGVGSGVNARPKKHVLNPDEFFIKTRFNEEIILTKPCWITTNPDGSHEMIEDAKFLDLWKEVGAEAKTGASTKPEGPPKEPRPDVLEKAEAEDRTSSGRRRGRPKK